MSVRGLASQGQGEIGKGGSLSITLDIYIRAEVSNKESCSSFNMLQLIPQVSRLNS